MIWSISGDRLEELSNDIVMPSRWFMRDIVWMIVDWRDLVIFHGGFLSRRIVRTFLFGSSSVAS